jgi:hypothetical protein
MHEATPIRAGVQDDASRTATHLRDRASWLCARLNPWARLREAEQQIQSLGCEVDAIRSVMRATCEQAGIAVGASPVEASSRRATLRLIHGGQR